MGVHFVNMLWCGAHPSGMAQNLVRSVSGADSQKDCTKCDKSIIFDMVVD